MATHKPMGSSNNRESMARYLTLLTKQSGYLLAETLPINSNLNYKTYFAYLAKKLISLCRIFISINLVKTTVSRQ